jgi:alpha/beta superfamily hydrolase
MKVYFSHGKESGPSGQKIQRLKAIALKNGLNTLAPDYTSIMNPDERVEKLMQILAKEKDEGELILVGSSMGAYVSLAVAESIPHQGIFLMAPAIKMEGYQIQKFEGPFKNMEIVHGWNDDMFPSDKVVEFAKFHKCPLHMVDDEHRLIDSLESIGIWFDQFLRRILNERE